jgi:hypothetical protein
MSRVAKLCSWCGAKIPDELRLSPDEIKAIEDREAATRQKFEPRGTSEKLEEMARDLHMASASVPRTTVKAAEGSRRAGLFGKAYGLAIDCTVGTVHPIEEEIRHVNEHFVMWLRQRGKQCTDLDFVFSAPKELHARIREQVGRVLNQPLQMDDIVSRLDIQLTLIETTTGDITELKISWQPR